MRDHQTAAWMVFVHTSAAPQLHWATRTDDLQQTHLLLEGERKVVFLTASASMLLASYCMLLASRS